MCITRQYIRDRNFVLTIVRDGANDKLLQEHVCLLTAETEQLHPFVELADVTELHDLSGFTVTGVASAGAFEFDRKPHKSDKLAILVSNDEISEMASAYDATSFYYRYDTRLFRDYRKAIEWLGVSDLENEINELRKE